MKFEIVNRFTGAVQVTSEIECAEDASYGVKLGMAVKWAIENGAYLADANLARANLAGANLAGAKLADAKLSGANLAGAKLSGAKWRDGITIKQVPLQLSVLAYPVTILDAHMQVGCELHPFDEWAAFDNARIAQMDGVKARRFWSQWKEPLLAMCKQRTASKTSSETDAA